MKQARAFGIGVLVKKACAAMVLMREAHADGAAVIVQPRYAMSLLRWR